MTFLKVTFPSFFPRKLDKSDKQTLKRTPLQKGLYCNDIYMKFFSCSSHGIAHCCKSCKPINLKQRQEEKKRKHKRNAPQVSCAPMDDDQSL